MRLVTTILLAISIAGTTGAVPVNPNAPDGVAAIYTQQWAGNVVARLLATDGTVWYCSSADQAIGITWKYAGSGLPVPIAEIADWQFEYLETIDGRRYIGSLNINVDATWYELPAFSHGPVTLTTRPMGNLKALFR